MGSPRESKKRKIDVSRDMPFTDLIIESQGKQFPVHKLVVCQFSDVLNLAVKDDRFKEGTTGVFKLDQFDPDVINYLLEVLYSGWHNLPPSPGPTGWTLLRLPEKEYWDARRKKMKFHIEVARLADYLQLPGLCEMEQMKVVNQFKLQHNPRELLKLIRDLEQIGMYEKFSEAIWMGFTADDMVSFIRYRGGAALDINTTIREDILKHMQTAMRQEFADVKHQLNLFWWKHTVATDRIKGCLDCCDNVKVVEEMTAEGVVEYCSFCRTANVGPIYSSEVDSEEYED